MAVVSGEGLVGKGLVRWPLVTSAQPSSDGSVAAGNALGEGEGLKLGGSLFSKDSPKSSQKRTYVHLRVRGNITVY